MTRIKGFATLLIIFSCPVRTLGWFGGYFMEGNAALAYDVEDERVCEWCRMREAETEGLVLGLGRLKLCGKCEAFFLPPWTGGGRMEAER